MLGVNGISMSGIAEILLSRGVRVSGSDLTSSNRTDRLKGLGAVIYETNSAANIHAGDPPDALVYTGAAGAGNPERIRAAELGITCIDRAELLGAIMAEHKQSIGIAGTHGKTTTSCMTTAILLAAGSDPTVNIGGEFGLIGGTSRIGGRDMFLAEACEYLDSFLKLRPSIAVITNVEYDHTDYFRDIDHLRGSFARYAGQAGGAVVINTDDENSRIIAKVAAGHSAAVKCAPATVNSAAINFAATTNHPTRSAGPIKYVTFGANSPDADFVAADIRYDGAYNAVFTLKSNAHGRSIDIQLRVPGIYNVYNALAAASAAVTAGCPFEAVAEGLAMYQGLQKRFEFKGEIDGYTIVDDYAHHPTAVRLALGAARKYAGGGRVLCVFHPHTYTRTRAFLQDFSEAFTAADRVLLADIFPAREKDPGDISSAMLADGINKAGGDAAYFAGGFPEIADWIRRHAAPGDLVLTMGAGHSSDVADILLSTPPRHSEPQA